jgi:hypothetical protein
MVRRGGGIYSKLVSLADYCLAELKESSLTEAARSCFDWSKLSTFFFQSRIFNIFLVCEPFAGSCLIQSVLNLALTSEPSSFF